MKLPYVSSLRYFQTVMDASRPSLSSLPNALSRKMSSFLIHSSRICISAESNRSEVRHCGIDTTFHFMPHRYGVLSYLGLQCIHYDSTPYVAGVTVFALI